MKLNKFTCDKNQKLKKGQNLKPQIVRRLNNFNCDKTQKRKS